MKRHAPGIDLKKASGEVNADTLFLTNAKGVPAHAIYAVDISGERSVTTNNAIAGKICGLGSTKKAELRGGSRIAFRTQVP
ncbi:MAG: hypothetical protein OTI36_08375 [Beijerinckiaceae bacterium]|nr:hypothetical protein [Beijerinckiaceae bacterium]